ncbi:hypothetical protein AGABI1DRAFT_92546 [Agaricus bisporus var. burnettii JB137-S8]|uniref:Uncharacterized protein n=1 Tax=Agaricus bisporus var. burnettii (strain JB137-S8 / ATCC MYA-4627 / FGSC 10392) TaxID=597362 RepID=K5XV77_AGABU|nr:uncharacterized protein AGABI1DRAFT_92546 [Agaricus bisporus var. burnettii JB137-S8]EKM79050.1 hypothetical protein AGABI1DRAFT_92546 [Agaricus bisporus var. burnettii JB137-S8]
MISKLLLTSYKHPDASPIIDFRTRPPSLSSRTSSRGSNAQPNPSPPAVEAVTIRTPASPPISAPFSPPVSFPPAMQPATPAYYIPAVIAPVNLKFPVSDNLYNPQPTPISRSGPPLRKKKETLTTGAAKAPRTAPPRYAPYSVNDPNRSVRRAVVEFGGGEISNNLYNPPPTPIMRTPKVYPSASQTQVPVLSVSTTSASSRRPRLHKTPQQLTQVELESPFELDDRNPARLLFPGPRPALYQTPAPQQQSSSARPRRSNLATSGRFEVSPQYQNPPTTPISNAPSTPTASLPIPVLDGTLHDRLEAALLTLRRKCPLCYYQGLPHHHTFFLCPMNKTAKLAGKFDSRWERWKGEIFVAELDTHCWSCYIPLDGCVMLTGKRGIKFHKGDRGFPDKDKTREGCMYRDTIAPMVYLAWRLGNMPELLRRYRGLDVGAITANLDAFSKWFISQDVNIVTPLIKYLMSAPPPLFNPCKVKLAKIYAILPLPSSEPQPTSLRSSGQSGGLAELRSTGLSGRLAELRSVRLPGGHSPLRWRVTILQILTNRYSGGFNIN